MPLFVHGGQDGEQAVVQREQLHLSGAVEQEVAPLCAREALSAYALGHWRSSITAAAADAQTVHSFELSDTMRTLSDNNR